MSLTSYPEPDSDHEEYLFWLQTHTEDDKMTLTQRKVINTRYEELADRMDKEYETQKIAEGGETNVL